MPDVSDLSWRIPFGPIVGSIMARRPPARPGIVYGGHELRLSDNDAQKKWGGNVHAGAAAGGFVAELQDDLKKVGCYDARVDGGYGAGTRDAVKRFQWCLAKATHRYAAGASQLSAFVNDPMVIITGNADRTTARHLKTWVADGFEVTGTLPSSPSAGSASSAGAPDSIGSPTRPWAPTTWSSTRTSSPGSSRSTRRLPTPACGSRSTRPCGWLAGRSGAPS
jgi:hypothetical protein